MVARPPRVAERLIEWATAWPDRCDVLGDLAEEFDLRAKQSGLRSARFWYWRQVARAIASMPRGRSVKMGTLWQDVRFSARALRRQPAITAGAVASLVVGISLCLGLYGLYDSVAVRPLPVHHARRLVALIEQRGADTNRGFSYLDYTDFRANARTLRDLVAFGPIRGTMTGSDGSNLIAGELVSGSYFEALGVPMKSGRGLTNEDQVSGAPVIVVSESLLRTRFGTDSPPSSVTINKQALTIVGVAAAPFAGLDNGRGTQFWAPLSEYRRLGVASEDLLAPAGPNWLRMFGVLPPGVATSDAILDLAAVEGRLERTANRPRIRDLRLLPAANGDSPALQSLISPLQWLLGGALLLLLVALANVAGLMVARAHERTAELAVRLSLGASRLRLLRLLTSEAALVGTLALVISLPVGLSIGRASVSLLSNTGGPLPLVVSANARLVIVAIGLSALAMLTILIPGAVLLPALRGSRRDQRTVIASQRFRQGLITVQFAISFGLVFTAVLLTRTLVNLRELHTGFDIDRVALISVDLSQTGLSQPRLRDYYDTTLKRLSAIPGTKAAGIATVIPLAGAGSRTGISVSGYVPRTGESMEVNYNSASGSYFQAMGISVLQGRVFENSDATASRVAVVNEAMAERYWGTDRAVGQRFRLGDNTEVTVVGVVGDVKYRNLREERRPSFYLSTEQTPPAGATFHVSVAGMPLEAMATLRSTIVRDHQAVLVTRARTLRQQADLSLTDERVATTVGSVTGAAAALLAAVGLFAAFTSSVIRRRREIGLRLALGASPASVRNMILKEALALVVISSIAGAGLGLALGRNLQARLYGIDALDPLSFLVALAILTMAAVAASWLPAQRASAVDPSLTLRAD